MSLRLYSACIPYSGLFPWGANFRYFRGSPGCHEIFHPRNFPQTCHVLQFGSLTFCYDTYCNLRPIDCAVDLRDPLSRAVPRVIAREVNREVEKA